MSTKTGNTHGNSNDAAEFRNAQKQGNVLKFLFSLGGGRTYNHNKPCDWGKFLLSLGGGRTYDYNKPKDKDAD